MKKNLLILSLLSLSLFFNSCRCEDEGPYLVDEDFKAYIIFPVGSWWVYENVETKEQDTTIVLTSESKWRVDAYCDIAKESIAQRIVRHGKEWEIVAKALRSQAAYLETELNSQLLSNNFLRLFFPLMYTESGVGDVFHTHETLDSTKITGQTFYDIIETRLGNQRAVFSKGVGIVAITYENGSSYVLKDYFIEEE